MKYMHLMNAARWHLDMAATAPSKEVAKRHTMLADRLFIRAYWARQN